MAESITEKEYEFNLLLDGIHDLETHELDALFEAGCDDATISVTNGNVSMMFSRKSVSLKDAIISAIKNVRASHIGAQVSRVDQGNLVTLTEIAHRIRRTLPVMMDYWNGTRGSGGFPPPVCHITEEVPLWYWSDVASWLHSHSMIGDEEWREAHVNVINNLLEHQHQLQTTPELTQEIMQALDDTQ